ncbi:MAG: DMT family transporter [Pseudomonadota bacterium]
MRKSHHISAVGMTELSLAQIAVSLNIVISKFLLPSIPLLLLIDLRYIIATIIAITFCFIAKSPIRISTPSHKSATNKDIAIICVQALCAGFLFNLLMLHGLNHSKAINAGVILSILPAAIALLSFIFLKEHLNKAIMIAIVLAIIGAVIVNVGELSSFSLDHSIMGTLFLTASVIPEALFTVIAKWHNCTIRPVTMTVYATAINAIAFTPLAIPYWLKFDFSSLTFFHGLLLVIYAFTSSIMFILWYRGIKKVSANIAGLFTTVMPISTVILSFIFLKENIDIFQFSGMVIIIVSIIIGTQAQHKKKDMVILNTE